MVHVVLLFLCIGIGMNSRNTLKIDETKGYVGLNIEQPRCKLTLIASEHVSITNEQLNVVLLCDNLFRYFLSHPYILTIFVENLYSSLVIISIILI